MKIEILIRYKTDRKNNIVKYAKISDGACNAHWHIYSVIFKNIK